jgi:predicted nucleic acid-binding protein
VFYLDTSAAVKLVIAERGSTALRGWLASRGEQMISSDLLRTELLRATRRGAPERMVQARAVLDALILVTLSTTVCERAALLEPDLLRSLDALHLAAALEIGDELEAIVTYDQRLAESAEALGISVVAPM